MVLKVHPKADSCTPKNGDDEQRLYADEVPAVGEVRLHFRHLGEIRTARTRSCTSYSACALMTPDGGATRCFE